MDETLTAPYRRLNPTLNSYRSVWVFLCWIMFFHAVLVTLIRYDLVPVFTGEGYLPGIYERFFNNGYYIFMGASFLGCVAYAGALLIFVATGRRSFALITGIPEQKPVFDENIFLVSGYAYAMRPLRDAVTLFPGLGFLGTVVGISIAIGGLESILEGESPQELTTGLRTAFDTTFLGLCASLVLGVLILALDSSHSKRSATTRAQSTSQGD